MLPDVFAKDRERLARFQREAKVLAALNHPNVAAIYGIEEADGKRFLVLELIEGETLAERLCKGLCPSKKPSMSAARLRKVSKARMRKALSTAT